MDIKEIKQQLVQETNPDTLYSLLISCGKRYPLSTKEKEELKKTIFDLCSHSSTQIRSAAIYVLCFYWGMKEYENKAWEMFSNEKEFGGTRSTALSGCANIYRNKNDKKILYSILKNKKNNEDIRETAYNGIFVISPLKPSCRTIISCGFFF